MWSLQRLHRLLLGEDKSKETEQRALHIKSLENSLNALLMELPHSLLRQYEYEDMSVRAGLHLMHSDFFKVKLFKEGKTSFYKQFSLQVLVALACDLELDKLIGVTDNHKWLWFRRYCHAARVAKALIHRTQLPKNFCLEVRKKFTESNDQEADEPWDHEKHNVFKKEHDEQLLAWLNRYLIIEFFL